ncbi:MAG: glycosyltransferase [Rikenellaceae bacterium]
MTKNYHRKPRVLLLLNIAPTYRKAILTRLDNSEKVDFFFAASDEDMQISKLMDLTLLSGFKGYLRPKFSGTKLIWQKGWFKLLFGKYDAFVLTANGGIRSNWLLTILARIMGKKVFLWGHGLYGNESRLEKCKLLTYMNLASGMLLYGNYGKRQLLKTGYRESKIGVVYNSLNLHQQLLYRDRTENSLFIRNYFGSDAPVVVFLGRLTPQKRLDMLLEALGVLAAQNIECNAIIVGTGPLEEKLKMRAKEIGVEDNVWFYGECFDESMIATLFKNATITVSPGNVGLTAMHSLSYGVPVITHNYFCKQMPEFEAIKAGYSGDFFKFGDSISLADTIHKWLDIMGDSERRKQISINCKGMIDNKYNPEFSANKIETFLLDNLVHNLRNNK